jgi:hypothetical protein
MTCARLPVSFWALLALGLALRCVALTQPLLDAHLFRQCQTAAATKSLLEQSGFPLAARIPWVGDLDGRYVLEFPLYNYLALGVHWVTGDLDLSGKLTSVILWALAFFLLQPIWRRMLDGQQTFWANTLFVLAPLSVFYGQAFMPEMLVQALAFVLLLATLRYAESPTLPRWTVTATVGFVALLVKLPEVSHLYFILAIMIFRAEGWRALFRPRYLIAGIITAAALKEWGNYADSVNAALLPEWSSKYTLPAFIGSFASRFTIRPWAMISLYVGAFIVTGPAALAAAWGLRTYLRARNGGVFGLWLISTALFYLVWFGNGGTAQSYYNLPALAPLCALFGIGVSALLSWKNLACWPRSGAIAVFASLVLCVAPVLRYLFKQDRQILAAAVWTRNHTQPDDLILFRANHRWDMVDYYYNPVLAYYADRRTFVRTRLTPEPYMRAALERASYAVVTLPPPPAGGFMQKMNRFRGVTGLQQESSDWLAEVGFRQFAIEDGFAVYKKQ